MATTPANALNIKETGIVTFDGTATFHGRTLVQGAGITISNANGVSGNPTISLTGGGSAVQHLTGNTGGQLNPDGSYNFNIQGTGSITVAGSGSTLTPQLTGLTNNAILYGQGTATIGLLTGNDGVLITSHTGVPSLLANGTTGQVLTATTGAPPSWATPSSIGTINGDSGSITGATVTIYANNATQNSGSSVKFVNSSTTSTFNVTDASFNTIIGKTAGNATLTSTNTTALGYQAGKALTSGANNTIFGGSGILLTTGGSNVLHGHNTGNGITTGSNNTILGTSAGSAYVTGSESSNLLLSSNGVNGESNVIRIGRNGTGAGQQNICYIASFGTSDTQSAYQAGTWTPTITGLTTSGTTTYTSQSGNYVRVGNIVTAWCECNISAMTGTGDVILGGFPFAFSNSGTAGIFTVYIGCWTLPTGCTNCNIIGLVSQTNARVQCNGPTNAITAAYLQAANISSNMVWTITYVK